MRIRGKLYLIVAVVIVGCAVSLSVLVFTTNRANSLTDMEIASVTMMRDVYRLTDLTKDIVITTGDLVAIRAEWIESLEAFDASLARLLAHPSRGYLSAQLNRQLEDAENVWTLTRSSFETVDQILAAVLAEDLSVVGGPSGIHEMQSEAEANGITGQLVFDLFRIEQRLRTSVASGRDFIVNNLGSAAEGIAAQADRITASSRTYALIVAGVVMLLGVAIVMLFSRRLSRRIEDVDAAVHEIADRDLSVRVPDRTTDEIGNLGRNLNESLHALSSFVNDVRDATHRVDDLKESLTASTSESVSAVNEISHSIESINGRFAVLNGNVGSATDAVESIGSGIRQLTSDIMNQAAAVEQSSTAIEQISASIGNVAKLSADRRAGAAELMKVIHEGGDHVATTNQQIEAVSREIDSILEIIEIINSISSQTNMLAMNAAIESAHAGEAGRGFSVVAEEIRKLAESTSENALRISDSLQSVAGGVREAHTASNASHEVFDRIDIEVSSFADALDEISTSMEQLRSASGGILAATEHMTTLSRSVSSASSEITKNTGEIERAMQETESVSSEVSHGLQEIGRGAREILDAIVEINRLTAESRDRMTVLSESVESFRTGDNHVE